ncbi:hypothetical protein [Natronococcus jeotgali]|uniref:Uncharacterized protein n=1 Tax=Natronococcus jeotgali DSM 18795 TaxID=1227498 RepID=L9X927_9EURY|nr:hypothetical protein [Natronococcus jeotgali]ELY58259.1 hypothetical protein C492_12529 [Natronococcus jeotgali DSM 18795]
MTELTIPPDADEERAAQLVREHVEVGDVVEVRSEEWADERQNVDVEGTVTALEPGYLELDEQPPGEGSVRYDEIHTISTIDSA